MTPRLSDVPPLSCACASLRRASRAVTQLYDAYLRSVGLRATQFTLLQAVARAKGITQGRLGEFLALDSTTLSRTLAPLEQRGWIRSRPGEDRRERHWELTVRGRREYQRVMPVWEEAQQRLRRAVGPARWSELLTLTAGVTDATRQP
jgi:DNA-binding MarR family transcriptional regulator